MRQVGVSDAGANAQNIITFASVAMPNVRHGAFAITVGSSTVDQQTQKKDRKPKAPPKTPEQKQRERRERFVKLASSRVNKALTALRNVARCGNRASYSYTPEEAAKIIGVLQDTLTEVQDAFSQKSSGKTLFSL